ncbi:MAG TPA: AzlD domain-containing protein [Pelomicrobium sp.]|nr:AzlD domain-containing protein [Pelomicrobium sp.]
MAADLARSGLWPWLVLLAAVAGTYLWRGLGIALSGRLKRDSLLFQWITCVTYAMLAALVLRIIILPVGMLAEIPLAFRLVSAGAAFAVMVARRGALVPALVVGTFLIVVFASL